MNASVIIYALGLYHLQWSNKPLCDTVYYLQFHTFYLITPLIIILPRL